MKHFSDNEYKGFISLSTTRLKLLDVPIAACFVSSLCLLQLCRIRCSTLDRYSESLTNLLFTDVAVAANARLTVKKLCVHA